MRKPLSMRRAMSINSHKTLDRARDKRQHLACRSSWLKRVHISMRHMTSSSNGRNLNQFCDVTATSHLPQLVVHAHAQEHAAEDGGGT